MSNISQVLNESFISLTSSLFVSAEEEAPPILKTAGTVLAIVVALGFFYRCLPATFSSLFGRVSTSSDQYLIDACKRLDKSMLDTYLKSNPEKKVPMNRAVYQKEENIFTTPLIIACKNYNPKNEDKSLEFISYLIKSGADINEKDTLGSAPLHHALWLKHEKLAMALIALGAKVNTPDESGVYPLNYAARFGFEKLVSSLIAKGADVEKNVVIPREDGTEDHYTPLSEAVENGHVKIAEILNADIRVPTVASIKQTGPMEIKERKIPITRSNGDSLLHLAISNNYLNMVEYLLNELHIYSVAKNIYEETSLHYAAKYYQPETMKLLLIKLNTISPIEKKEFLNSKDTGNQTALVVAANLGYFDIVKMLADAGADTTIDISTPENKNLALLVAAVCGKVDEVERLIKQENANPHVTTKNGTKLLKLARENGQTEVLKFLQNYFAENIEKGGNIMEKAYQRLSQKKSDDKKHNNPGKEEEK